MRKLTVLLLLASAFVSVNAQVSNFTASNGLARDSVSNTGTETWDVTIPGAQKTIGIQIIITKISGTVAGSITLKASVDGTNYFTIPGADTATATDVASQSFGWQITDSKWQYYRLSWTGSGTMSASAIAKAISRRN